MTNLERAFACSCSASVRDARIGGLRSALAILALLELVALYLAQRIPTTPPGRKED